jgi:hypothetical protein
MLAAGKKPPEMVRKLKRTVGAIRARASLLRRKSEEP